MPRTKEPIALSWSGGKDSAMAHWELRRGGEYDVVALVTVLSEGDERITMHGVTRHLLEQQAKSLGLPLELVFMPKGAPNSLYTERLGETFLRLKEQRGLKKVAFGDLFLDDLRDFREEHLDSLEMEAEFPLWHRCTKELSYAFLNAKFKAVVSCVDEQTLDMTFAGRPYDRAFLADLPITVDPCGENGEFHTFVYDGPTFAKTVPIKVGTRHSEDHFHFCEIAARAQLSKSS